MLSLKCSRTTSPSNNGTMSEDISPILRETDSPNFINILKERKIFSKNEKPKTNFDSTSELITKLNQVSLKSEFENCALPKTASKCFDVKKSRRSKKELDAAKSSNKSEINLKEDLVQSHHTEKSKPSKARRTKKKKDSFIVSDTSSIENDSVTLYHRVLTERIKADVKKITPRARSRKMIESHDHGIFTPFIARSKRASSESSSSDKENDYNEGDMRMKVQKTEQCTPKFSKTKVNSIITISSASSDELTDFEIKKKFPVSSILRPTVAEIFRKDLSWCFSDKESSQSEEEQKSDGKTSPLSSKRNSSDDEDNLKPVQKTTTNRKSSNVPPRRPSITQTPITFRLKQVNKLTPKSEPESKVKRPMSFLSSLSMFNSPHSLHPEAELYKKKFKKMKEELATKLFRLFNEEVFDNKLPCDTKIEWNARMRSSSGFCYNKRIKTVIGPNNECVRSSRIALSTKIIETTDRLRDTLIHEMCHAAAWIIDNKLDGHGPCWKAWASKAMRRFPELPPIKRCHDYAVKTKFKYKCVNCGYTIGRHSKSLNLERKRCGYCYGKFELIVSNERHKTDTANMSPRNVKARPLSKFALFVKENYSKVKSENTESKHGDVMKILSKNFAATKSSN